MYITASLKIIINFFVKTNNDDDNDNGSRWVIKKQSLQKYLICIAQSNICDCALCKQKRFYYKTTKARIEAKSVPLYGLSLLLINFQETFGYA
jgi:hypothetical protein